MRILLPVLLIAVLAAGCHGLSSEEEKVFYFDLTYEGTDFSGAGSAAVENGILRIRGEYFNPDSSQRYVELTVPDFNGESTYALQRAAGIYGSVDGEEETRYGYSSGHPQDGVRIDGMDVDGGVLLGAFFFYGTAFVDFDEIAQAYPFAISGRFRTAIE